MDYIRRLHECILTQCSKKLESTGILPLFDIVAVSLTDAQLKEFGTQDYILYRLQQELRTQFVTRKQNLLKTLYTYIANSNYVLNISHKKIKSYMKLLKNLFGGNMLTTQTK